MIPYVSEIERAFQLAKSGAYRKVDEIKKRLVAEGYSGRHIIGRVLLRQLREQLKGPNFRPLARKETQRGAAARGRESPQT